MRAIPILMATLLMAGTAVAQTSGGGSGAGGASSSGGSSATVGSSPSGAGATSQPAASNSSATTTTGSTAATPDGRNGSPATGLRASPAQDNLTNAPGGIISPPLGSGGPVRAADRNCKSKDGHCGTEFNTRYMRLVDSMVKTACPRCDTK